MAIAAVVRLIPLTALYHHQYIAVLALYMARVAMKAARQEVPIYFMLTAMLNSMCRVLFMVLAAHGEAPIQRLLDSPAASYGNE
ncbi:MAG: hypothetical protein A2X49_11450 [Lentisphaerae bacterium GWF2_52_8]|nr:MAG: hypothetical protein A2X49_11450 [Lentisphaerae bacterium GWF2_52_8]